MSNIKVTIGIPVYNSEAHISTCLDSIINQTMPQHEIEVIAVNDGSTDSSGDVLEEYAAKYHNITVHHQENTGGPGSPRNYMIQHAAGEFIFFVDVDDYLGPEAVDRMYEMGKENDTDIIIGKFTGVNGRGVAKFKKTQPKTTVFESSVLNAIGPTKMFRRSFLLKNNIYFPVGVCTAEDQPFMVKAYILASGISIVGDYPCYYVVNHTNKEHASMIPVNPEEYYKTLEASLRIIRHYVKDEEKKNLLIAKYLNKELITGRSILFAGSEMPIQEKAVWLKELNKFLAKWVNSKIERQLTDSKQAFLSFARDRNLTKMREYKVTINEERTPAATVGAGYPVSSG
ncbi:glycosyltransferase [Bacillus lacus]|uniref:Glycosyltransferase n=1 Tax=Metabacillus lacus TaxID=1983721 RepID=A0A7X2J0B3_9BACI|nr:glycosyltransferase family A protein [Metabacillus lacus]MRX72403.1 glycosyltransferase [Metabacillus lacus]